MEWSIENSGAPSANGRRRAQDLETRVTASYHQVMARDSGHGQIAVMNEYW